MSGAALAMGVGTAVGSVGAAALSDGGGSRGRTRTGYLEKWTPWQRRLGQEAGRLLSGGAEGEEPYPGELPGTEGPTDIEKLSLQGLEEMFGGETLLKQQQEALAKRMDPDVRAQELEEYFQTGVSEPMYEEFREEILPEIRGRYAPSGFWGGERIGAEEEATEDLIDSLTQARAGLAYKERQGALEAMGMVPESWRGEQALVGTGLAAGEQLRGIEESGRKAEFAEWLRQQEDEDKWLSEVVQVLGLGGRDNYAFAEQGRESLLRQAASGTLQGLAPELGAATGDYLFGGRSRRRRTRPYYTGTYGVEGTYSGARTAPPNIQ